MVAAQGEPRRVFVCDDSYGYPLLLKNWLAEATGVDLAGVAMTAGELLSKLPRARADVLLLDLMLPDGVVSADLVKQLRGVSAGIRVVLASAMPDSILQAEAARVGADSACSKLASRDELLSVILD